MAYNEILAEKIRRHLCHLPDVIEKPMMGGLTFMVEGKMCIGVIKNEMMCRIAPDDHAAAVEMPGCRSMDFTKRPMAGFVMIDEPTTLNDSQFQYWISQALSYNPMAKSSIKKKKK
ncbi:MAG: hypothetical protein RIQ89_873 [Bacteroidota bacterium]|jgi:TfoX/Sxy family transcriptional regulator of competence genes